MSNEVDAKCYIWQTNFTDGNDAAHIPSLDFFFLFSLVLYGDAGTEDVSKNVGPGWTSWRRTIQVKAVWVFFPFTEKQNILDLFILNANDVAVSLVTYISNMSLPHCRVCLYIMALAIEEKSPLPFS